MTSCTVLFIESTVNAITASSRTTAFLRTCLRHPFRMRGVGGGGAPPGRGGGGAGGGGWGGGVGGDSR